MVEKKWAEFYLLVDVNEERREDSYVEFIISGCEGDTQFLSYHYKNVAET